jgi:hypothetical protein
MLLSSIGNGGPPGGQHKHEMKNDDDPYSGFGIEEVAAPLQTDDLEYDEGFQSAVRTSHGRRPPGTASGVRGGAPATGRIGTTTGLRGTATGARPITGKFEKINQSTICFVVVLLLPLGES